MTDHHGPVIFTAWLAGITALGIALGLTLAIATTPTPTRQPTVTPITSISPTDPPAR